MRFVFGVRSYGDSATRTHWESSVFTLEIPQPGLPAVPGRVLAQRFERGRPVARAAPPRRARRRRARTAARGARVGVGGRGGRRRRNAGERPPEGVEKLEAHFDTLFARWDVGQTGFVTKEGLVTRARVLMDSPFHR